MVPTTESLILLAFLPSFPSRESGHRHSLFAGASELTTKGLRSKVSENTTALQLQRHSLGFVLASAG